MLDKNGLSIKDQNYHVFHYNYENEFTSSSLLKIEKGTGLPANSTLIPILKMKDGFTQVFNADKQKWEYIEDHRYKEVWNIKTKQKEEINYVGKIKNGFTEIEPPSMNHDFINDAWVITEEKQAELDEIKKKIEISELESKISKLENDLIVANLRNKDTSQILKDLDDAELKLNEVNNG